VAGSYEQGNECWNSIRGEEFLDQLDDYQLLKEEQVP
jgi:hypothetical protein